MTNTHPSLLALAEAFDALHTEWLQEPPGERRDEVTLDRLNDLAEAIRIAPVTTMAEAAAKARNLLWAFGLTHPAVPALDDDPARQDLAAFVAELGAVAAGTGAPAQQA